MCDHELLEYQWNFRKAFFETNSRGWTVGTSKTCQNGTWRACRELIPNCQMAMNKDGEREREKSLRILVKCFLHGSVDAV